VLFFLAPRKKTFEHSFIFNFHHYSGGKTSLLNILGTIDTPTKGTLRVGGRHIR
jgi:hypothetical protein